MLRHVWVAGDGVRWGDGLPGALAGSRGPVLPLLHHLTPDSLGKEEQYVLPAPVGQVRQVRLGRQATEDVESRRLAAAHQRAAATLLPTVAVGGGRGSLQFAVVAAVADPSALGATAEGVRQATRAAFKDVLEKQDKAMKGNNLLRKNTIK